MVNIDILAKRAREKSSGNWPELAYSDFIELEQIKSGFPGIGSDHITIVDFKDIKEKDIFIYSEASITGRDEAPLMLMKLPNVILPENEYLIIGIGKGEDSKRDPQRLKLRWRDCIEKPALLVPGVKVFRVDVRPTLNGGPGYYYFFRSYRDFRP